MKKSSSLKSIQNTPQLLKVLVLSTITQDPTDKKVISFTPAAFCSADNIAHLPDCIRKIKNCKQQSMQLNGINKSDFESFLNGFPKHLSEAVDEITNQIYFTCGYENTNMSANYNNLKRLKKLLQAVSAPVSNNQAHAA